MIRQALCATLLLAAAPAALANDARLASRLYNPDEVVRIEGRLGVQASIAFAEDEHIENVAIGDSAAWQITPNKRANLLFVKPLAANSRTNMTVVTDRHTYFFDLAASAAGRPLYVLRFTYPEAPATAPAPQPASAALTEEESGTVAGDKPVDPAELNFAWEKKGDRTLFPDRIYDDGQATYISWASGAQIPAILIRNEKGDEGPVNFAVRGDVIVVDGVPASIFLKSGRGAATLENRGTPRQAAKPAALAAAKGQ